MPEGGRTLRVQSLGFLMQSRLRRMLALSGWHMRAGWPKRGDRIGVWGAKPVSRRGRWVSSKSGAPLLTIEDGFLRSVRPGVSGDPPISIVIDDIGFYADASRPSRLEQLLTEVDLDPAAEERASAGIKTLRAERLSKYSPPVTKRDFGSGFVLVIDQTVGDASIAGAAATPESFRRMLAAAKSEHPGQPIVIKAHPDVLAGAKRGHFGLSDGVGGVDFLAETVNPWDLLNGASAVYTVSSQIGYEAVLAGVPVRTFGCGFYAGWGLTDDETTCPRRTRTLTRAELFHGCHIDYPIYYDPWRDTLCEFETAAQAIACAVQAETPESGSDGEVFAGVRLWKRRNLSSFRPQLRQRPVFEIDTPSGLRTARTQGRALWVWASRRDAEDAIVDGLAPLLGGFVEDGFLRSVGLGAELTSAASFVFDRSGIYFDPRAGSDLETLIDQAARTGVDEARVTALIDAVVRAGVTKYNIGNPVEEAPAGRHVVLVPGQVEDDASVLRGCGDVRTNLGLLQAAREANPEAWLIYKPHPDVEAGLRVGAVEDDAVNALADQISSKSSAAALLDQADAVWTMTSLMGLEALMRNKPVTCLGLPFYAGWGLTDDLGPSTPRRRAKPSLTQLVWAALIAYPRYVDPVSGLPCPVEVIVERLASGQPSQRATALSRLQGMFAGQSWLWR